MSRSRDVIVEMLRGAGYIPAPLPLCVVCRRNPVAHAFVPTCLNEECIANEPESMEQWVTSSCIQTEVVETDATVTTP